MRPIYHKTIKSILLLVMLLTTLNVSAYDYYDKETGIYYYSGGLWDYVVTSIGVSNAKEIYKGNMVIPAQTSSHEKVFGVGWSAFSYCYNLNSIKLSEGLKKIYERAFKKCTGLTKVTLPESLNEIKYNAFEGCTSLPSIEIPSKITAIARETFSGCTSLSSITLPDSLNSIGEKAFYNCEKLTLTKLPQYLTTISDSAFYGCASLTSIEFPEGLTKIGDKAFAECVNIQTLLCNSVTPPSASASAFDGISKTDCILYVPENSSENYKKSKPWSDFIHIYEKKYVTETLRVNDTLQLANSTESMTWTSSDESIATVSATGLVCAKKVGTVTIEATASNGNLTVYTVTVKKGLQTLTWDMSIWDNMHGDSLFVDRQLYLSAISSVGLKVNYSIKKGSEYASLSEEVLTGTKEGTVTVYAYQNGDSQYEAAEKIYRTYRIKKNIDWIEWEQFGISDTTTYRVGDKVTLTATSYSGLPITYTIVEGSEFAEIVDKKLICKAAGNVRIEATQSGNYKYETISARRTVQIHKGTVEKVQQTITWEQSFNDLKVGDKVAFTATTSSRLSVEYAITQGSEYAELSGDTLICKAAGEVTIEAKQAGDDKYEAAESVSKTISINKKAQSIGWEQTFEDIKVGDKYALTATTSSGLSIEYVITQGAEYAEITGDTLICKAAGEVLIEARQAGDNEYEAAESVCKTVHIGEAEAPIIVAQSIAIDKPSIEIYIGRSEKLNVIFTPENTTDKTIEWTSSDAAIARVSSDGEVVGVCVGTATVTAKTPANLTAVCNVTVNPLIAQRIDWEQQFSNVAVGDEIDLIATATSGFAVEFVITQGSEYAEIVDGKLICKLTGDVTIEARQEGCDPYVAATNVSKTIHINKKTQSIGWEQELNDLYVGDKVILTAAATTDLPIEYTITHGSEYAELTGDTLICKAIGEVLIEARQAGDNEYESAESVSKTFSINKKAQSIEWEQELNGLYVGDKVILTAAATADLPIEYAITQGAEYAELSSDTLICKAAGEVLIEAKQAGDNEYEAAESVCKTISINKKTQSIGWAQELNGLYVGDKVILTAAATTNLPIEYVITQSSEYAELTGDTLICKAAGEVLIEARQAGDNEYEAAESVSKTISINKKAQSIGWEQTFEDIKVGDKFALTATTSSGLSIEYVITQGGEYAEITGDTLICKAAGEVTIEARQIGSDEYESADSVSKTISINKKAQSIGWEQELNDLYVGDKVILTASATTDLPIEYVITQGEEYAELTGDTLICKAAGEVLIEARQAGDDEYEAAESVSKTISINKKAQSIGWAQELNGLYVGDKVILTASATTNLPIEYVITQGSEYAELSGDTLICKASGEVTIEARQIGSDEYEAAESVSKTISINKKAQSIEWEQSFEDVKVGNKIVLAATASSGLAVEYALTQGSEYAELAGDTLICKAVGDITIEARQAGDDEYAAAESVSKTVHIGEAEAPIIVAQSIAIDKPSIEIYTGRIEKLNVIFTPENTTDKTIEWTSSDATIASVSSDGEVFGVRVETATITAKTPTGLTAVCNVTVKSLRAQIIYWEQLFSNVKVGDEIELTASASSGLAVEYTITHGLEYAEIVDGKLICKAVGDVTIEARQDGCDPYVAAESVSKTIHINEAVIVNIPITIDGVTYDYCEGSKKELQVISNTAEIAIIKSEVEGLPVTTINRPAFYHDLNVTEVYIPASVTEIKDLSFEQNYNLTTISVDAANPNYCDVDGILYSKDKKTIVTFPAGKATSYTVIDGTTVVGDHAFSCNAHIESVTIPEGVTSIGFDAFFQCYGLTSFVIPSTVTSLDFGVLRDCSNLKEICSLISNPSGVLMGVRVFEGVDKDKCILYVPKGTKTLYETADQWKDFTHIVEVDFTDIEGTSANGISFVVRGLSLLIRNAPVNSSIRIYTVTGQLVYAGHETTILLPAANTYIIEVNGRITKIRNK